MISLTLEECKNFQFSQIDYTQEEIKIRDKNINILYDLIDIILDNNCLKILEDKTNNYNHVELPYKLILFYKKYINEITSQTKNQSIISKIRAEYNDLITKIVNFAERWSYEEDFIKNKLLDNNDLFLLTFAKDPGKQTFHQHFVANWLKQLPFVENFQELPTGGKDALYVLDGNILKGETKKLRTDKIIPKSIDFYWVYSFDGKYLKFYATHKHTKVSGGSQDNQYRDVQDFHIQAKECKDNNCCLLSITDGFYYLMNETGFAENKTKIEYLNSILFKGNRNFATNSNMFIKDTIPYIISWLQCNFSASIINNEIEKLNIIKNTYYNKKET